jgi:hypothetical protein
VFQPESDGISDGEWLELTRRASGGGRHFFTENQLYLAYAQNRVQVTRRIARRGLFGLALIAFGLCIWVYALKVDWGLTLVLGIAVTLGGVGLVGTGVVTSKDPARRELVSGWLAKWTTTRALDRLLCAPSLAQVEREYLPADSQCLIIVERETVVDLLLKNGAHRELSALIIAASGYPRAHLPEAERLLGARPNLLVIALHDATLAGVAMPAHLRGSDVFSLARHRLIDAGLFPADVTWLAELAPAIPAGHTHRVPVDSLSYDALLLGLRAVCDGALSLAGGIAAASDGP